MKSVSVKEKGGKRAKFTAKARHTLLAVSLNKGNSDTCNKGKPFMNHCFIETLPSRCRLSGKGISTAVYRTVGVRCQPGPSYNGLEELASSVSASIFSLMTNI